MSLSILRLGHRLFRDQRLTTHLFLTARSLGARQGFYTGQRDQSLESSLEKTAQNWGGTFPVSYVQNHKPLLKKHKGEVVHLTAYGLPFGKELGKIQKQNLLVVVGGEKVPPDVFEAGRNLSVSNQPISEVSALGIFLYELQKRTFSSFPKAPLKIIPQEHGKLVEKSKNKK